MIELQISYLTMILQVYLSLCLFAVLIADFARINKALVLGIPERSRSALLCLNILLIDIVLEVVRLYNLSKLQFVYDYQLE